MDKLRAPVNRKATAKKRKKGAKPYVYTEAKVRDGIYGLGWAGHRFPDEPQGPKGGGLVPDCLILERQKIERSELTITTPSSKTLMPSKMDIKCDTTPRIPLFLGIEAFWDGKLHIFNL